MKVFFHVVMLMLTACAAKPYADTAQTPDRRAFADISRVAPEVIVDMRYAGSENFVGRPIDGYEAARCLLTKEAAHALAGAQQELAQEGLSLLVYDCYRPQRAVDDFVRWTADENDVSMKAQYYPNIAKSDLFPYGYIAEKSGHSRGSTVDLTIGGLDMGSGYDLFDPISHTNYSDINEQARKNRQKLKQLLAAYGFKNYEKEWWHFTLSDEPYPDVYFDFAIK